MTEAGPLGRNSMSFPDKMARYHGEIERLVYAAEQMCNGTDKWKCDKIAPCKFKSDWGEGLQLCDVFVLRSVIGDHILQHDIPAVPPCQCGGECNKQDKP